MYNYISIYDIRHALSELSDKLPFVVISKISNKQAYEAEWTSDLGLDSLQKLELAQILEKKVKGRVIEDMFSSSSERIGDFLFSVNFRGRNNAFTLAKIRAASDVLKDVALSKRIYAIPDETLLRLDIHKDIGMTEIDISDLLMQIECQNLLELPLEVSQKMAGPFTIAETVELINSYCKPF
ncbi:MAG: hypothetical protein MJ212_02890 [Alphaproteobacteria bacterium]|nr:hypothetical protein [Alphaproteobacteria bacterium]